MFNANANNVPPPPHFSFYLISGMTSAPTRTNPAGLWVSDVSFFFSLQLLLGWILFSFHSLVWR